MQTDTAVVSGFYRHRGRVAGSMLAILLLVGFVAVAVVLKDNDSTTDETQGPKISLSGAVNDELGQPLAFGALSVNGVSLATIENGQFQVSVDSTPVYQLRFEAPKFYPITHTFSRGELVDNDGNIPPVTLVARKPGRTMFAFGGDVMAGRRYYKPLTDDQPLIRPESETADTIKLLENIKPYLVDADIASANLEIVVAAEKPKVETPKSVIFYARPPLIDALKQVGVDYVTLGNNHVYDFGDEGVVVTQKYLDQYQMPYSGGGLNEEQALKAHQMVHGDNRFQMLGYVGWKGNFSPNQVAEADKGGAAWGSEANIEATVKREAASGNPVVVQYHGSNEYTYEPTEETVSRAKLAIDSGADLVVIHHPHVVQGFEIYNGKLIAYSLGNFLFDQYFQETHRSAMLYVWMDGEQFVHGEVVPLYVQHYQTTPAVGAVRQHVLRRVGHQSSLAGLTLGSSGGHSTISPAGAAQTGEPQTQTQSLVDGQWSGRVLADWQQRLVTVEGGTSCQLGRDLLVTGGFESAPVLPENPGTWNFSDGSGLRVGDTHSGDLAVELAPLPGGKSHMVTRGFHRLVEAEDKATHSFTGMIYSEQPQSLDVCLEYAPRAQSFTASLDNAPLECLGTIATGSGEWTPFTFDFPPVDHELLKGYRIRLQSKGELAAPVRVDDLSWTAWQQPVDCSELPSGEVTNFDRLKVSGEGQSVRIVTQ
ncbi:CapA family protein [Porticoccus sp. W117]|uniref:CapA family protein n=1 Tax=Porticoccus sp. W117 TaxID=3054777 RepID=UPI0025935346|nr:CapA family protein [Porticoccus sp. W117]MDM3871127.1 CapA family protein [Porticoccus sp. W117]